MIPLLIYVFVVSWIAFIIFGYDKRLNHYTDRGLPTSLLVVTSIFGPFGALMGMILFNTRLKDTPLLIAVPLLLIIETVAVWLLRGYLV